jgi:Holliday junction resolvase RusA-like endonuclease
VDPSILPTSQKKGIDRVYTKAKVRKAAEKLLAEIKRASEYTPMEDHETMNWFLSVVFVYPLPKGYPKHRYGTYKRTSPGGDDLLKMVQDVITQSGLYWMDDSQVQIDNVIRRYQTSNEQPRILISIKQHKEANF